MHDMISASDKDWKPVTDKLFSLALLDLSTGEKIPYFKKEEMRDEIFEQMREDDLIEKLFGLESRLSFEEFVQRFTR